MKTLKSTALKVNGLTLKWNLNSVLGFTDQETLKCDFDDCKFGDAKQLAEKITKRFKMGGYILLRSSKDNYHAIFDREVTWSENISIMSWVALTFKNKTGFLRWFLLQGIRQASTLRVSSKKEKSSPRIVFRFGCQKNQIEGFLLFRLRLKRIMVKAHLDLTEQNENV